MPNFVSVDADSEVLGHLSLFNRLDTDCLERIREIDEGLVAIELATEGQSTRPCEDGCDWVSAGGFASLVITVVAGYGTMCRFCFHSLAIWRY